MFFYQPFIFEFQKLFVHIVVAIVRYGVFVYVMNHIVVKVLYLTFFKLLFAELPYIGRRVYKVCGALIRKDETFSVVLF